MVILSNHIIFKGNQFQTQSFEQVIQQEIEKLPDYLNTIYICAENEFLIDQMFNQIKSELELSNLDSNTLQQLTNLDIDSGNVHMLLNTKRFEGKILFINSTPIQYQQKQQEQNDLEKGQFENFKNIHDFFIKKCDSTIFVLSEDLQAIQLQQQQLGQRNSFFKDLLKYEQQKAAKLKNLTEQYKDKILQKAIKKQQQQEEEFQIEQKVNNNINIINQQMSIIDYDKKQFVFLKYSNNNRKSDLLNCVEEQQQNQMENPNQKQKTQSFDLQQQQHQNSENENIIQIKENIEKASNELDLKRFRSNTDQFNKEGVLMKHSKNSQKYQIQEFYQQYFSNLDVLYEQQYNDSQDSLFDAIQKISYKLNKTLHIPKEMLVTHMSSSSEDNLKVMLNSYEFGRLKEDFQNQILQRSESYKNVILEKDVYQFLNLKNIREEYKKLFKENFWSQNQFLEQISIIFPNFKQLIDSEFLQFIEMEIKILFQFQLLNIHKRLKWAFLLKIEDLLEVHKNQQKQEKKQFYENINKVLKEEKLKTLVSIRKNLIEAFELGYGKKDKIQQTQQNFPLIKKKQNFLQNNNNTMKVIEETMEKIEIILNKVVTDKLKQIFLENVDIVLEQSIFTFLEPKVYQLFTNGDMDFNLKIKRIYDDMVLNWTNTFQKQLLEHYDFKGKANFEMVQKAQQIMYTQVSNYIIKLLNPSKLITQIRKKFPKQIPNFQEIKHLMREIGNLKLTKPHKHSILINQQSNLGEINKISQLLQIPKKYEPNLLSSSSLSLDEISTPTSSSQNSENLTPTGNNKNITSIDNNITRSKSSIQFVEKDKNNQEAPHRLTFTNNNSNFTIVVNKPQQQQKQNENNMMNSSNSKKIEKSFIKKEQDTVGKIQIQEVDNRKIINQILGDQNEKEIKLMDIEENQLEEQSFSFQNKLNDIGHKKYLIKNPKMKQLIKEKLAELNDLEELYKKNFEKNNILGGAFKAGSDRLRQYFPNFDMFQIKFQENLYQKSFWSVFVFVLLLFWSLDSLNFFTILLIFIFLQVYMLLLL